MGEDLIGAFYFFLPYKPIWLNLIVLWLLPLFGKQLFSSTFFCQTRVVLLNWCAWFLRMKRPGEDRVRSACQNKQPRSSLSSVDLNISTGAMQSTNGNLLYIGFRGMDAIHYATSPDSGVICSRLVATGEEDVLLPGAQAPSVSSGPGESELSKILDEVQYIAKRFRDQDEGESMCNEWKFAASVIDRLCLMAFSLFTILCTIGI